MRKGTVLLLAYLGLAVGWQGHQVRAQTTGAPAVPAGAPAASALVLEAHGTIHPRVTPYQEVAADTQLTLAKDAKLVFLHYSSCREVTVVGGVITFKTQTYTMTDGAKETPKQVDCPRQVVLKAEGSAAGILMRGAPTPPTLLLPTQLTFVLVGRRADAFATVQVTTQDGVVVLKAPLEGRRFQWPQGTPPLRANTAYKLTLVPEMEKTATATVSFTATAPTASSRDSALALVRVD